MCVDHCLRAPCHYLFNTLPVLHNCTCSRSYEAYDALIERLCLCTSSWYNNGDNQPQYSEYLVGSKHFLLLLCTLGLGASALICSGPLPRILDQEACFEARVEHSLGALHSKLTKRRFFCKKVDAGHLHKHKSGRGMLGASASSGCCRSKFSKDNWFPAFIIEGLRRTPESKVVCFHHWIPDPLRVAHSRTVPLSIVRAVCQLGSIIEWLTLFRGGGPSIQMSPSRIEPAAGCWCDNGSGSAWN